MRATESDARYGSFDFRAAHAAAPRDLQQLLDGTESLPFRRRGYERDGLLKTIIDRAGFHDLFEARGDGMDGGAGKQAEALASVPADVAHCTRTSIWNKFATLGQMIKNI